MKLETPTINALGTINVDQVLDDSQVIYGVWHYRPNFSYLVCLRATRSGLTAFTTSMKTGSQQLTDHMQSVQEQSGMAAAMREAFEWLEEQTKPRRAA